MMGQVVEFNYLISRKIDPILDRLSNGGLEYCCINTGNFKFLSFEIREAVVTPDAWNAAQELHHIYKTDRESRDAIEDYAFAIGASYGELQTVSIDGGAA